MKITCKLGPNNIRIVEVSPDDHLYVLLNKLNITDKKTKFIFEGMAYNMASIQTFQEIGLTYDTRIFVSNQAIAGGGEDMNRFANLCFWIGFKCGNMLKK